MSKTYLAVSAFVLAGIALLFSGCQDEDEIQPEAEFSTTSEVTITSVEVTVTYTKQTGTVSEQGVLWGDAAGLSIASSQKKTATPGGTAYTVTLPELTPAKAYFIRPYAIVNGKEFAGTEISVTTETAPTYTTVAPLTAGRGQRVKITGTFLTDDATAAAVTIGGLEATILSFSATEVEFLVPDGAQIGATLDIGFTIAGYPLGVSQKITISRWSVLKDGFPHDSFYGSPSMFFNGDFFLSNAAYRFSYNFAYRYNVDNDTWEMLADANTAPSNAYNFPAGLTPAPLSFTINGKGYMGAAAQWNSADTDYKHLYEFDAAKGSWTRKADFPGVDHNPVYPGGFVSRGSKGYYLASGTAADFWEYNATTDVWTKKADYPGEIGRYLTTFAIDDYVFFGAALTASGQKQEFYAYNTTDNTWTQAASIPATFSNGSYIRPAFTAGKRAFVFVHNQIWIYDFESNSWSLHDEVIPGSTVRTRPALFVQGDYVIIGSGSNNGKILVDFYRWYPPVE